MRYVMIPTVWKNIEDDLREQGHERTDDLADADFLIYNGKADAFPHLPDNIRFVQLTLAGIDAFFDAGIIDDKRIWANASGIYAKPVAESALMLLLGVLHRVTACARKNEWDVTGTIDEETRWLYGTHIGLIGAGGIGRALIPMLTALGCTVTAVNHSGKAVPGAHLTLTDDNAEAVMAQADHVILAAPLTATTKHMVNARVLRLMKKSAVLINVGRGPLVNTDDLVKALQDGQIAGAGLDVTDPEPLPADSPLWGMDTVLITPHVANSMTNLPFLLSPALLENLTAFEEGRRLPTQIDLKRGY